MQWIVIGCALLLGLSQAANGQDDKRAAREREQLRRLQAANQKLEQDLAAQRAENARTAAELKKAAEVSEALKAGLASEAARRVRADRAVDDVNRSIATERAEKAALRERLEQAEAQLRATSGQLKDTQAALTKREGEGQDLSTRLGRESKSLEACRDSNAKLYGVSMELIGRLENLSSWDKMLTLEPFTQLKRAQLDALAESFRDQADAARLPGR